MLCDHTNSADVKSLFDRIANENNGVLDLLVNNANAYSGAQVLFLNIFIWNKSLKPTPSPIFKIYVLGRLIVLKIKKKN